MAALSLAGLLFRLSRAIFLFGNLVLHAIMLVTVLAVVAISALYLADVIDNITVWTPNDPYMSPA